MENYKGKNSLTEFNKVIIKKYLINLLLLILLICLCYFLIMLLLKSYHINKNGVIYSFTIISLIFTFLFKNIFLVFIVIFIINIIKKIKINLYYKKNDLINIRRIMVDYDYKLWLTAVKDSFHPMSFHIEEEFYKTDIIFTNSRKYYLFNLIKIPSLLNPNNYINNYAIIGFDEKNNKYIIIDYDRI
ncbi:MAG: hypothetical protein ACI35S_08215 [Anaeroplasma sp.]